VSPHRQPAPKGFRWADQPWARALVSVLAIISLGLSLVVGYQYVDLIDCLQDRAQSDAVRTKAIADATDRERAADRDLLAGPGTGTVEERRRGAAKLRERAIAARAETDRVRAANPAPPASSAECG
jgi:hypothetical protein